MKYFALLTLSILVVACNSSEVQKQTNSRFNVGTQRPGDVLLARRNVFVDARPNVVQFNDFIYRGGASTIISAIRAYQVGPNQFTTAHIISGGIGFNHVTIRFQSAIGFGFNLNVEIFGRN